MEWIDYLLLAVVAASTIMSLFRGFFREAVSLGTWVVALWLAWKAGPQVAGWFEPLVATVALRFWLARVCIVVVTLLAGGLLNWVFATILGTTGLSGTDRLLGMAFGFGRGMLLAGLLVMGLDLAEFRDTEWWHDSKIIPYTEPVADIIRHAAEDGMELLEEMDASSFELPDSFPGINFDGEAPDEDDSLEEDAGSESGDDEPRVGTYEVF